MERRYNSPIHDRECYSPKKVRRDNSLIHKRIVLLITIGEDEDVYRVPSIAGGAETLSLIQGPS